MSVFEESGIILPWRECISFNLVKGLFLLEYFPARIIMLDSGFSLNKSDNLSLLFRSGGFHTVKNVLILTTGEKGGLCAFYYATGFARLDRDKDRRAI